MKERRPRLFETDRAELELVFGVFQSQAKSAALWYETCSSVKIYSITPNDACQLQPEGPRGTGETGAFFSVWASEKKLGRASGSMI
jgi:hypothetical protein